MLVGYKHAVPTALAGLLVKAIRETGRTPVQRNTCYEPIKVWEAQMATGAGESHAQKSAVLERNLATA